MFVRTYNQAHPTSLEFVLFNTGHRLHSECQHHIGCGGKEDSVGCHGVPPLTFFALPQ
jgi:hypothetical protein